MFGIRYAGLLQSSELWALDQFFRLRVLVAPEKPDPRLVIITIDEEDVEYQKSLGWKLHGSLSDYALLQVLQKLNQYQAKMIGIDIYRDIKTTNEQLLDLFKKQNNLFMVCKVGVPEANILGIGPPEKLPAEQLGFSDFVIDNDNVVRRQLISFIPDISSLCQAKFSFNFWFFYNYFLLSEDFTIEWAYFQKLGFDIKGNLTNQAGDSKPINVVFKSLFPRSSGYQKSRLGNSQILLNYRSLKSPDEIAFKTISLRSFLKDSFQEQDFQDRLVLMGVTIDGQDEWETPYTNSSRLTTYGVFLQAQMISQMLSAVLDNRPLLWFWSGWKEFLWIWLWSAIPSFFVSKKWQILSILAGACLLTAINFYLFIYGGWLPLIPIIFSLMIMMANSLIYHTFFSKHSPHYLLRQCEDWQSFINSRISKVDENAENLDNNNR